MLRLCFSNVYVLYLVRNNCIAAYRIIRIRWQWFVLLCSIAYSNDYEDYVYSGSCLRFTSCVQAHIEKNMKIISVTAHIRWRLLCLYSARSCIFIILSERMFVLLVGRLLCLDYASLMYMYYT